MNDSKLGFATKSADIYFQQFLKAYIQNDCHLICVRTPITKVLQIESIRSSHCKIVNGTTLSIQDHDNADVLTVDVASFEKIEWFTIPSSIIKVIQITLKNDRNPIVLAKGNCSDESLDFWFDGLRLFLGIEPSTNSSNRKLKIFQDAINYSSILNNTIEEPVIPPPPSSTNYPPSPKMPVILAKK